MVLDHGRDGGVAGGYEARPSASTACWAALLRAPSALSAGMIPARLDLPFLGVRGVPTRVVKERMAFDCGTRLNLAECPEMRGVVVLREAAEPSQQVRDQRPNCKVTRVASGDVCRDGCDPFAERCP